MLTFTPFKCLYPVTIQNFYSACYYIIYLSRLVFIQYFCNRVFININDICHVKRILELIYFTIFFFSRFKKHSGCTLIKAQHG